MEITPEEVYARSQEIIEITAQRLLDVPIDKRNEEALADVGYDMIALKHVDISTERAEKIALMHSIWVRLSALAVRFGAEHYFEHMMKQERDND